MQPLSNPAPPCECGHDIRDHRPIEVARGFRPYERQTLCAAWVDQGDICGCYEYKPEWATDENLAREGT